MRRYAFTFKNHGRYINFAFDMHNYLWVVGQILSAGGYAIPLSAVACYGGGIAPDNRSVHVSKIALKAIKT